MNSRLLSAIFSGLILLRPLASADDVGIQYIKTRQIVCVEIENGGGILTIKDKSTYSKNLYFVGDNSAKGENTLMLHANALAEIDKDGPVTVLREEAVVCVTNGVCRRIVKVDDKAATRFLLDLKLNDKLPEQFDVTVAYSVAVSGAGLAAEWVYRPVFENEDFMPPILFSGRGYCIRIKAPSGYVIRTLSKNPAKKEGEYTTVFLRSSDAVRIQIARTDPNGSD